MLTLTEGRLGSLSQSLKVAVHRLHRTCARFLGRALRLFPGGTTILGLPRRRIRSVKRWVRECRATLDWMERCKGPYYEVLQPPLVVRRRRPHPPLDTEPRAEFSRERHHVHNEVFLARLPGARVLGPGGVVLTSDGGILEESTWGKGWLLRDRVLTAPWMPVLERLPGHYLTVATLFSEGYAHWLLDALPRLAALERLPIDEVRIVVSGRPNQWQQESLAMLGVDPSQTVALEERYLELETLYFPSFVGEPGNPHPWGCQWLRQRVLGDGELERKQRRIYITRRRALRRRVLNESELEPVLREHGFEIVEAERLGFHDQIRLFGQAEAIVGPHGAGLTNIMFAPPGCKVMELFGADCVRVMYWALADALQQSYWYLIGDSRIESAEVHQDVGFYDIYIPPASFARSVTSMLRS